MSKGPSTRRRILDAALRQFNLHGYSETTIAQIAAEAGIAVGNLTYHFRTKADLVDTLQRELADALAEHRKHSTQGGDVADDYVTSVIVGMKFQGDYRFLLRDHLQLKADRGRIDAELAADYRGMHALVRRLDDEGLFRRDIDVDLDALTRSLFIVTRYWSDHLQDHEGRQEITWEDQVAGFHHHLMVLRPWLTASGRRSIEAATARAIALLADAGSPRLS